MGTRLDGLHWLQAAAAVSGEMALQAISVLLEKLTELKQPKFLILNKIDTVPKEKLLEITAKVNEASMMLAQERGPCPDAADQGVMERFSCKMAIAPTASISIICGGTSACIEPIPANIYTHKTLSGSFSIRNPYLEKLLIEKAKNSDAVWHSILEQGGSVQHLDFLSQEEKDTYKTSFEIDQRWLLEFAADRTPYIDQAQSLNLFIPADVDKWDLMMLHYQAWERGIKSLYYLRSKSVQRAGFVGGVEADNTSEAPKIELSASGEQTDYEECLACQ
jgi:ribonucleoside-diphosphate reductase alpha chain